MSDIPDSPTTLQLASTDELVEELCRRHVALVAVVVREGPRCSSYLRGPLALLAFASKTIDTRVSMLFAEALEEAEED